MAPSLQTAVAATVSMEALWKKHDQHPAASKPRALTDLKWAIRDLLACASEGEEYQDAETFKKKYSDAMMEQMIKSSAEVFHGQMGNSRSQIVAFIPACVQSAADTRKQKRTRKSKGAAD